MEREAVRGHLAALFTVLVWGTTFISTKVLLEDFQPVEILFARFVMGFLALLLVYPRRLKGLSLRQEVTFAAAGLCGGSVLWTGVKATRLALAGFIIPFVMIYAPEILMIGDPMEIVIVSVTALIGVYALATATVGYYTTKCTVVERIVNGVAGIMLVVPNTMVSLIGLIIFAASSIFNRARASRKKIEAA